VEIGELLGLEQLSGKTDCDGLDRVLTESHVGRWSLVEQDRGRLSGSLGVS